MRTRTKLVLSSVFALAACGSPQHAGRGAAQRPEAQSAPATSSFDGEVIGVDRLAPDNALKTNVRLVLRPQNRDPVTVELAPGWYLEEQGLSFSRNQRVRGRGRRSDDDGGHSMVAWQIQQGERVIPLRDQQGRPLWQRSKDAEP